ncbi:DUF6289 family protein [Longispora urticae]
MIRRVLLAAALAGGAIVGVSAPAQAIPQCPAGYTCSHNWYTDSSQTYRNGYRYIDCRGNMTQGGTLTGYYVFRKMACDAAPSLDGS